MHWFISRNNSNSNRNLLLLWSPFYSWANWGIERLSDFLAVIQLVVLELGFESRQSDFTDLFLSTTLYCLINRKHVGGCLGLGRGLTAQGMRELAAYCSRNILYLNCGSGNMNIFIFQNTSNYTREMDTFCYM